MFSLPFITATKCTMTFQMCGGGKICFTLLTIIRKCLKNGEKYFIGFVARNCRIVKMKSDVIINYNR